MHYVKQERHIYSGEDHEVADLVGWLMRRGYWVEYEARAGLHNASCGVEPEIVTEAAKRGELKFTL